MTTTHPDLAALLRAVCEFPGDDTLRLVLADRLDDLAGTVACPDECACGKVYLFGECEDGDWEDCPTCRGTGTVSDGFAARAELIRVQCWIAQQPYPHDVCPGCGYEPADGYHHSRPDCPYVRADELLTGTRRREWAPVTCRWCEGRVQCTLCGSTGFAPLTWERGFPVAVRCRLADVLRQVPLTSDFVSVEHTPMTWALTPWAKGVLAAHPVTRWEIVDREPVYDMGEWGWWEHHLPAPVMQELGGDNESWFKSPELARDALARAVGRVARRLAGLREVPT